MRRPSSPPASGEGTSGTSASTRGETSTTVAPESDSTPRPTRKRQRVSRHDFYQSTSLLRGHALEENLLERDRYDVHGDRVQGARAIENRFGARRREHRQDPAAAADAGDARRLERGRRRLAVEHELHALEALAQIVERAADDGAAAIDDRDSIGNLLDLGNLVRGEEDGHPLARRVA